MAVGVVGAMLGFWIVGMLGFVAIGGIARVIAAFAGAVLLIFIPGGLGILRKT